MENKTIRQQIRKNSLARRDALASEVRSSASSLIAASVLRTLEDARRLHCYLNFRSEVETRTLIASLLSRHCEIVVPVVQDGTTSTMEHHLLTSLSDLDTGHYGLPLPKSIDLCHPGELDAVIVPLAAFDRDGNRLGYGKGFYDKFLSELGPTIPRIGLAFAVQETDLIPTEPHDQTLHFIITESEIITTSFARSLNGDTL